LENGIGYNGICTELIHISDPTEMKNRNKKHKKCLIQEIAKKIKQNVETLLSSSS